LSCLQLGNEPLKPRLFLIRGLECIPVLWLQAKEVEGSNLDALGVPFQISPFGAAQNLTI
jgi:hypothetical protein